MLTCVQTQVEATQHKIVALARRERGTRTREEFFGDFAGISFNSYANFESGKTWPRSRTLRQLEKLLGWEDGIIDAVVGSGMEPSQLNLAHMHGQEPLTPPPASLAEYPSTALLAELARRAAEQNRHDLAASDGGGNGIGPEDLPNE